MTGTFATFQTADARLWWEADPPRWCCTLRNLNGVAGEVTGHWGTPDGALREALELYRERRWIVPEGGR